MPRTANILLFDYGAILATNQHLWQAASRVGSCYLPQIALDEIDRIAKDASANPAQNSSTENAAVEFRRFLADSDWQTTDYLKPHPELTGANTELSRRSRLSFMVAQYAYGISTQHPDCLTILVTDEQNLIRKINELGIDQLCATTAIAIKQWALHKEVPAIVERANGTLNLGKQLAKQRSRRSSSSPKPLKLVSKLITNGLLALVTVLAILFVWQQVQPQQFKQFWQKTGLPQLPTFKPSR